MVSPVVYDPWPQTVVVTNYVERVVEVPAPNFVELPSSETVVVAPSGGPRTLVIPSSQSMAAWSALNSGDLGRAGAAFQDMLTFNPTDARALVGRGVAYMLQDDDAQATACFRLAIASDTGSLNGLPISSALAAHIRARCEALWSQPEAQSAFVAAVGYAVLNQPDLAVRVASRAIELGDTSLTTAQLRSQLSYALGGG